MNYTHRFLLCLITGLVLLFNPVILPAQTNPFDENASIQNPTTADNPFGIETDQAYFEIDGSWVNVRTGPGTDNPVIDTLPRGSRGKKIEERNGWSKIDFGNGLTGWVYNKLLAEIAPVQAPVEPDTTDYVEQQISRWEKHLGDDILNYRRFPWWWRLKRADNAFRKGKYEKALKLAQKASGNPIESAFMQARCLAKLGETEKANKILQKLEKHFEDRIMVKQLENISQPYIDEPIVFKFGGYDTIEDYKEKKSAGKRLGLESSEYYEKFVDIKTWKWRSKTAHKEFQQIGGIDCSGFVQRIQESAFKKAGVKYPISQGRTSTSGLWSQKFTDEINPGVKPPPPPDIRPGDMILLDYGHNRYGHSMIYKGKDSQGNIIVIQMGDTAQEAILPAHKYQYYKGTYRMKGMDKVRETLTA
jgi:uncharacterized protein YraI